MNKINYDVEMQKIINATKGAGVKPRLLLHSCCAPCSSACIERLLPYFEITVIYYNPNIDTASEHDKRLTEQEGLCKTLGIDIISFPHLKEEFLRVVNGYEKEKEGGARCEKCFKLRLEKTAELASEKGYDYFATTLTVSPLKNAGLINKIGIEIAEKLKVKYLPSDFKKQGGYQKSIELSKQYGLYRQNYCGCEFSKND